MGEFLSNVERGNISEKIMEKPCICDIDGFYIYAGCDWRKAYHLHILFLPKEEYTYTSFKFQAVPIKNMAEIEESTKLNEIKIGTIYTVSPAATMRKVYSHYGIVTDIKENGIEIFHLNKEILNKYGTKVFVAFSTGNDKIFNFDRGVKFFPGDPLTEDQIKYMRCRMEDVLSKKHIPYGLKYKDTYNCESLVSYIKTGQKNISSQVFNFENKFGKIGSFIVSNFDKVMIVTNKLGYIKCYFDNEKKND